MPIETRDKSTWVAMGTGDIAMCGAAEEHGNRRYVILQQHTPGEQGHSDEVGREFPVKDGFIAGRDEVCVILEFGNAAALQELLLILMGHGDHSFPEAMDDLERLLAERVRQGVRGSPVAKCTRCDGCRQIADSEDGEPWTVWADLAPGADLAVRMGVVKPIPCPACAGAG